MKLINRYMKKNSLFPIIGLMILSLFVSCDSDDIKEEAFHTFTQNTVGSFIASNENTSTFNQIVQDAGYGPLLSVYGHYTVFVPSNESFDIYFQEKGITFQSLTTEDKISIANDHIIKGRSATSEYLIDDFQEGALPLPNMNNRFLNISFVGHVDGVRNIFVNKRAPISTNEEERNRKVHNGVVHILEKVLESTDNDFLSVIRETDKFTIFAEALRLTGLNDSINKIADESYRDPSPGVDFIDVNGRVAGGCGVIHVNKYGYTMFAEPDKLFNEKGINSIEDLIAESRRWYSDSKDFNDYTSRDNPLNKFVSYHILDRRMATNAFIYQGRNTAPFAMHLRHEYYETMLKKRLMEIKADNMINTLRNGDFVGVDESESNIEVMNGYIHALTDILIYDEDNMINDVLNKRIRIDAHAIPPQLTNNNIRWNTLEQPMTITPDLCGEHLTFNDATKIILWASEGWDDYQADQMILMGWYDFTLRLPPMPPGTYEIRFGYNAVPWRNIAQLFVDGEIAGIPVDLTMNGTAVGWVADSETLDNGVENDKMMRNRGYMKAGAAIYNSAYGTSLRNAPADIRVIVGTYTWHDYDYHTLRIKNVERESGEFHLDYIEIVPVSHLEVEDRN